MTLRSEVLVMSQIQKSLLHVHIRDSQQKIGLSCKAPTVYALSDESDLHKLYAQISGGKDFKFFKYPILCGQLGWWANCLISLAYQKLYIRDWSGRSKL